MKFITVTELSALGKSAIALIITFAGLLEIPAVGQIVTQAAAHHPHIAVAVTAITGLATLLANPQVQKVLNITVPANSTLTQTTTVTTPKEIA